MKIIAVVFCFVFAMPLMAQEDAWIFFTDKPEASFYLANPSEMLSEEALNRRANLNISVDILDVPIHSNYVNQIENQPNIQVLAKSKWLNAVHVRGAQPNIESLANLSFVSEIEFANKQLNSNNRLANSNHNNAKNLEESAVQFSYGNATNQIEMLNGHLLHAEGFTGEGMIIAVIDNGFSGVNSGIAFNHLYANNQVLDTYNFVNRQTNVYSEGNHGTAVLSTIAAKLEGQFVGTAPDANYILLVSESNSYENPLEESLWVEAAEYADSLGADVINTSLGYNTFDNPNYDYSYEDMNGETSFIARGANISASRGMVCVISAGNSGNSDWQYIATPADADDVLTIGAVNASGNYASFSSIGPTSDGRTKPNVVAQGASAAVVLASGNLTTTNGTSLSSPIIAGLVACLWQSLPTLQPSQIIDLIENSASLFPNSTPQMGFGIPDFYEAKTQGLLSSVNQIITSNEAIVYPNPTSNILNIQNAFKIVELTVYSAQGQIIEVVHHSNSIDCSKFPSGMYFLKIKNENGHETIKFLKH